MKVSGTAWRMLNGIALLLVWVVALATLVSCGGGGGGGDPPAIAAQPVGSTRIVGQKFVTSVSATGVGTTYAWESSVNGSDPWVAIAGATSATLTIPAVAIADHDKRFRAKVSNAVGTVTSGNAALSVEWGSVETSGDLSHLEDIYAGGGGDGGTSGGGDGAGADGGGALGKTLNALMTVTRLADGALVGQALTHGSTGLVKIKAGPGACPCLLTLTGNANATYYDEGIGTYVPFDSTKVLHALVDTFDENIGVSGLTEAAYRYALNNYMIDPNAVKTGAMQLRSGGSVVGLSLNQVQSANRVVQDAINSVLPTAKDLSSIKSLSTPIDQLSDSSALKVSRYGKAALLTGGLAINAYHYLSSSTRPGLDLVEQLARDLTDGRIDGFSLDGESAAPGTSLKYARFDLPITMDTAMNAMSARFGVNTTSTLELSTASFGQIYFGRDPSTGCGADKRAYSLKENGNVSEIRYVSTGIVPPSGLCFGWTVGTTNDRFLETVKALYVPVSAVNRKKAFAVQRDGTVWGWGDASCGMLGDGSYNYEPMGTENRDNREVPTRVLGLSEVTSLADAGYAMIARDSTGSVYAWGQLPSLFGLGLPTTDCTTPQYAVPTKIPTLANIVKVAAIPFEFFAINANGDVYFWGTQWSGVPQLVAATPTLVGGISGVVDVDGTSDLAYFLKSDGTVWTFGGNQNRVLSNFLPTPTTTPTKIPGLANISEIAGDVVDGGAALDRDGVLYAWNSSNYVTPTVPTTVTLCDVGSEIGANCLSGISQPFPKTVHIYRAQIGTGLGVGLLGADGKSYVYYSSMNWLWVADLSR